MIRPLLLSFYICSFFLFSLFSFSYASAQEVELSGQLNMDPEYPKPFQKVTISFETYSFDGTRSLNTWSVNGKKILSGYGENKIHISLLGDGSLTTVSLVAIPQEGGIYKNSMTISPASVSLMWEARDSYTPPFYKGKSLPSEGGGIRLIASPRIYENGKKIDTKNISYAWTVNDVLLHDSSGLGKNTYSTDLNYLENENIYKVVATSLSGRVQAEGREKVSPFSIQTRLYKSDGLLGTEYAHALGERVEIAKETTFTYEPYFLHTKKLSSPNLSYNWTLNGLPTTPQGINYITIIPKKDARGFGTLSISVENIEKFLQKSEASLSIIFDTLR